MEGFFRTDNPVFVVLGKAVDLVCLSLLFLLLCIPTIVTGFLFAIGAGVVYPKETADGVVLMLFQGSLLQEALYALPLLLSLCLAGPAATALYYAVQKVIRHGRGYIWREFWHGFKSNFKQAAVLGLVFGAVVMFFFLDLSAMYQLAEDGQAVGVAYPVFLIFLALAAMWGQYLFPYLARFENGTGRIIKNTVLIAIANLPLTIVMFLILALFIVAVVLVPPAIFIAPSCCMLVLSYPMERIFAKYMTPEDAEAEKERNSQRWE